MTDEDPWNCIEWSVVAEQVSLKHRAYLSGRGITKAVISFTAPVGHFSVFGEVEGTFLPGGYTEGPYRSSSGPV